MNFVANNNKESLNTPKFTQALRSVDCGLITPEKSFYHENIVSMTSYSPNRKYILTASDDKTSKLWSVKSGECLYVKTHDEIINSLCFSPDGKYIVTASPDKTVRLWSAESGECLMTINEDDSALIATFNSDGKSVITISDHKMIRRQYPIKTIEDILERWSEILGDDVEPTDTEKEFSYNYLNNYICKNKISIK